MVKKVKAKTCWAIKWKTGDYFVCPDHIKKEQLCSTYTEGVIVKVRIEEVEL